MLIFENPLVLIPLIPLALISLLFATGALSETIVRRMDLPPEEKEERLPRAKAALRLIGVVGLFTALCAAAFFEASMRGMPMVGFMIIIVGFVSASIFFIKMMKELPKK
ncbi:MAG: hypothetical protein FWE32_06745 [Oscillospiraceae bacterium]|nr:hypothetical protein [Oscillospiraceae bacterium]